jgi:ribosomal-protein-alanine N-acetyltransferase
MSKIIRRGVAADMDALLALERSVPEAAHWSPAEYVQILHPESQEAALRRWIFVAEDGELKGFIVVKLLRAGQQMLAEIENLAVSTAARRKGTGSALCTAALEACRAVGARAVELEVRAGNSAAIGLYTRLGFEQTGIRAGYYTHPKEDAVLLRISLQSLRISPQNR